ncbi:mechanosensitive ion channel domain-containing protein [Saccharopolyspora oryzae]|uniref:Mechanosensitive ion channel n=1 Tax=Saccharopolyspora oryzae TaxID=2997343 RepID=A0ABT4UQD0_9PSEU|nr:mechanosensitive ion channel domain-containing protein [Saccharopolyspora oryzae]MDA3623930.1 mechanosensitive ion channel [Saccharopolyspora oryzae]
MQLEAGAATPGVDIAAQAEPVVDWFSSHLGVFVSGLINIAIILVVAFVARAVVGRLIAQLVKRIVTSQQRINKAKAKANRVVTKPAEGNGEERQAQRAYTIGAVLGSIASFVIFGVAFMMVLGEFGINIAPVLASAGVVGLAIGFGAQSLVQDFLSGLFLMVEDQFGVGDVVDVGDAVGTVEAMTMRTTKIRDLDGNLWHVRNGEIMRVCNMNQDWANAVIEIPLDYSVDLPETKRVLESSLDEFAQDPEFASQILEKPDVNGVVGIGNGAVTMRMIIKTKPGSQWAIGRAVRGHVKNRLDQEGIQVAYPLLPHAGSGATKQG